MVLFLNLLLNTSFVNNNYLLIKISENNNKIEYTYLKLTGSMLDAFKRYGSKLNTSNEISRNMSAILVFLYDTIFSLLISFCNLRQQPAQEQTSRFRLKVVYIDQSKYRNNSDKCLNG